ncbi:MAG: CPBP family intramembrane glutamic endopeptidase [Desulfosarcina sp.]
MSTVSKTGTLNLLPQDRTFYDLMWPYVIPYLIYVALSSMPESLVSAELGQIARLPATAAAMIYFGKVYRFGPLKPIHGVVSIVALPLALLSWIGPFYLLDSIGLTDVIVEDGGKKVSYLFFCLKIVNTVVLVAIFEELFMRVYVLGWFYQAGSQRHEKGLLASIVATLDQVPAALDRLPLSVFSVVGATIVFSAGHHAYEYLSAVCYFLFTTWLYHKSRSLWVCIFVHGLTNLSLVLLAVYGEMGWLW